MQRPAVAAHIGSVCGRPVLLWARSGKANQRACCGLVRALSAREGSRHGCCSRETCIGWRSARGGAAADGKRSEARLDLVVAPIIPSFSHKCALVRSKTWEEEVVEVWRDI